MDKHPKLKKIDLPEKMDGTLQITCNDFDTSIRYDVNINGNYDIVEEPLNNTVVSTLDEYADQNIEGPELILNCQLLAQRPELRDLVEKGVNAFCQDPRFPDRRTTQQQMVAIAFDFHFMVYSMKYSVKGSSRSRFLKTSKPAADFYFYPFHRPLYHQAEAALDAVIWDQWEKEAWKTVEGEYQNYQNMVANPKPDEYPPFKILKK